MMYDDPFEHRSVMLILSRRNDANPNESTSGRLTGTVNRLLSCPAPGEKSPRRASPGLAVFLKST